MERVYYVGLDIHKKMITYCIKLNDGTVFEQGSIEAERGALRQWLGGLPGPWKGALSVTAVVDIVHICAL